MEPQATGEPSYEDIEEAFLRANRPIQSLQMESTVGQAVTMLDEIMRARKKR